jgi:hypothetical protein
MTNISYTSFAATPLIPNSTNVLKASFYYFNHIVSYDDSAHAWLSLPGFDLQTTRMTETQVSVYRITHFLEKDMLVLCNGSTHA